MIETAVSGGTNKLSNEAKDRILASIRAEMESGECQPRYCDSPLGLWSMVGNFVFTASEGMMRLHKGAQEEPVNWRQAGMPCEFVPVSMNVLDAYATCVLAADIFIPDGEKIVLSCQLEPSGKVEPWLLTPVPSPDLMITLRAVSDGQPCFATNRGGLELIEYLPAAIAVKEMPGGLQIKEPGTGFLALKHLTGCVVVLTYPGRMFQSKVPYLLQHPAAEWPRTTIRFLVDSELRQKARRIVDFLLNDPPASARDR